MVGIAAVGGYMTSVWHVDLYGERDVFLEDGRSDLTSVAKLIVSPASTGLIQRSSRNPGEGPQVATSSPRAAASLARR